MGDSGTVPIPFRCYKGFANFASTACYEVRLVHPQDRFRLTG